MSLLTGSRHLGDDDLIRYIDHALDHEGMRLSGVHLRTCGECTARLDGLRQQSASVHEWLSLLPAQPDPARRAAAQAAMERARFRRGASGPIGAGWMKAAAAIVLMVGLGMATEPGRAFVAGGIVRAAGRDPGPFATRMVEWLGQRKQLERGTLAVQPQRAPPPVVDALPESPPPAAAAPAPRPALARVKPGTSAPVRFRPAGPDVTITFAAVQPRGSAQLWIREDATQASVQATRGYRGEELATSPAGLVVRNGESSRADYTIIIPARYRYIRVRVGDGPESAIPLVKGKDAWYWTIPLQSSVLNESVLNEPEP
jgi:hypothetical protein